MTHQPMDPERLLVSAQDPLLRSLLEAGTSEVANAEQLAAVSSKLGPVLAASGAAAAVVTVTTEAAGAGKVASTIASGMVVKVIGVLGVGAIVTVGAAQLTRTTSHEAPHHLQSSASSGAESPKLPAVSPLDMAPVTQTEPEPAPIASASHRARPAVGVRVPPQDESMKPESEVKLLQAAQDALARNPSESLAICAEHRKYYPAGLLAQERDVMVIDALVRLHRQSEAEGKARQFVANYPSSSHTRRIETLLGKEIQK